MKLIRRIMAIDLGTSKIATFVENRGVIVNEPSVVTMDTYKNKIISYGETAKKLIGRVPGNIVAKKPINGGTITDFNATESMIKRAIKKSVGKNLFRPNIVACVPSELTQVQKRAVIQAVKLAGANKVVLIEQPIAIAMGIGMQLNDAIGTMVIDIGAGKTDISVISNGDLIIAKSINIGGNKIDESISDFIRIRYNMLIGETTAEKIKLSIASVYPNSNSELFEVKGRNVVNGLPMHVFVNTNDISKTIELPITKIINSIIDVLGKTPPELVSDIFTNGVILTGGSSKITGLVELIRDRAKIEIIQPEHPELAVIKGAGKYLKYANFGDDEIEYLDELKRQVLEQKEQMRKR